METEKILYGVVIILAIIGIGLFLFNGHANVPTTTTTTTIENRITVNTDKTEYEQGDVIEILMDNNLDDTVFFHGCNQYDLESKENGKWKKESPLKMCVWEGYAIEIPPKVEENFTFNAPNSGIFRIIVEYFQGCQSNKPISGADCKKKSIIYSNEFTIKEKSNQITVRTDKTEYEQGETVRITTANSAPLNYRLMWPYYEIERKENNQWKGISRDLCSCPNIDCDVNMNDFKKLPQGGLINEEWGQKETNCSGSGNIENYYSQVNAGVYRMRIEIAPDVSAVPDNIRAKIRTVDIYSNEFVIKKKSVEILRLKCCNECKNAFGKSPVDVGPEMAKCGEFSTAEPLGEECENYFKNNSMTVSECSFAITPSSSSEVIIITDKTEYERGEIVKITMKNNLETDIRLELPPYTIERFDSNNWIEVRTVFCPCETLCKVGASIIRSKGAIEYQWNQKEEWCSEPDNISKTISNQVVPGRYRIGSKISDPDKRDSRVIYSDEFIIKSGVEY